MVSNCSNHISVVMCWAFLLIRLRYGKVGLQLGAHQKYYISQCEEKKSIQLTITVVGNDAKSVEERKKLIDNIYQQLDEIMKLFMPAIKKRPKILFPCPFCTTLHITLEDVSMGSTIYCTNASDVEIAVNPEYYGNLLSTKHCKFH